MATKEKETPTGEKEQQGRGGGDRGATAARPMFIEEGNRTPVAKATHARYGGGDPVERERERERAFT
jgi:hypothetical protein